MFELLDKQLHWISVKWPALIPPEGDESGLSESGEHEVELRVEILDKAEFKWRFDLGEMTEDDGVPAEGCADPDDPSKWGPRPTSFETFKRIVHAWRKIAKSGRRVDMTDDNIRLLLRVPMFEGALAQTYVAALGGVGKEREKNSSGSPDGGPTAEKRKTTTSSNETATVSD